MLVVFWRPVRALSRRQVLVGIGLGALYGLAQIFQTQGLATTPASVSGFITGTYVVLTPVFTAVLLRERVPGSTWAAVGLATGGLALLSLNGLSVGVGEAITLLAAALYALHIVGLGRSQRLRDRDRPVRRADARHRGALHRRGPPRRCRPAEHPRPVGHGALHGRLREHPRPVGADVGAGAHAGHPGRDHHDARAGLRRVLRRDARRRDRDAADGPRWSPRAHRDVCRRAPRARRRPGELPAEALHHEV